MPNANRGSVGFKSSEFEQEYERPSKSAQKREVQELADLGKELVDQPRDRVKRVPMPEALLEAILVCQGIKDFGGRKRQLQYVGKKMRDLEPEEVAVIRRTIEGWRGSSKAEAAALHALERKREKLLADDKALTALAEEYPDVDVQHLRTLIRNSRKEQAENKPPKAYREIFQILKELEAARAAAAEPEPDAASEDEDE